MRVCLISHGNMVHVIARLEFMVARGWDVHWLQIAAGQYNVPGVTVHELFDSTRQSLGIIEKLSYIRAGLRARRLLADLRPDVVWPHYVSSGGLVAWLSGWPRYCVTIHGSDLLERGRTAFGRALLRRILARAVLVNPVAEHMTGLLADLGVPGDRVFAKTHGIRLDDFPFAPSADCTTGTVRIICTRTFNSPLYDIPTLLRAVAVLYHRGRDVILDLAATGPMESQMRDLVAELGVDDVVRFGGGFMRADLPKLFGIHDLYVSSSLWDGTSVSLLEAMACGIMPVVTDIPANSELIRDGENGFLFAAGNHEQLAAKIELAANFDRTGEVLSTNRELVESVGDQQQNLQVLMDRVERVAR